MKQLNQFNPIYNLWNINTSQNSNLPRNINITFFNEIKNNNKGFLVENQVFDS